MKVRYVSRGRDFIMYERDDDGVMQCYVALRGKDGHLYWYRVDPDPIYVGEELPTGSLRAVPGG